MLRDFRRPSSLPLPPPRPSPPSPGPFPSFPSFLSSPPPSLFPPTPFSPLPSPLLPYFLPAFLYSPSSLPLPPPRSPPLPLLYVLSSPLLPLQVPANCFPFLTLQTWPVTPEVEVLGRGLPCRGEAQRGWRVAGWGKGEEPLTNEGSVHCGGVTPLVLCPSPTCP